MESRDSSRDPFFARLGLGLEGFKSRLGLEDFRYGDLNIAKKWFIKISMIQRFFACCICRWETTKTLRKIARNLRKFQVRSDDNSFLTNWQNAQILKSWVSASNFKSRVSEFFDEVSVSTVTVSPTSLVDRDVVLTKKVQEPNQKTSHLKTATNRF